MTENFLQRWSRLKRDPPVAAEPAVALRRSAELSPGVSATPDLPAPDALEFSSDFTAFMGKGVEDGVRRVALQKLFHADHFNVMDGLDVYIEDYNSFEPIGEELLRNLNQARGLIFDEEKPVAESTGAIPAAGEPCDALTAPPDEPAATGNIATEKNP